MPTVKDHYISTAEALNAETEWKLEATGRPPLYIPGKISYHLDENAKYWSFYFPKEASDADIAFVLKMPETLKCSLEQPGISQSIGFADRPESFALESFHFTKRIYLYIDQEITTQMALQIEEFGSSLGLSVVIRDQLYAKRCEEMALPLAFISHDSKDKNSLVRDLAINMSQLLCPVWYDEFSLKVGDSLRENIERGIKEAKKCIVVLSPNFIANGGWTKAEFDSIYQREVFEKSNVILPIWHQVNKNDIYEYCPRLLDRFALDSSMGATELAKRLRDALKN